MDFSARKPAMLQLLKEMVETESPTYDKEAVDQMGALMIREAKKLGAEIEIHPHKEFGNNIVARWGKGEDGILLIGHIDTVFPLGTIEMQPFYEKYGKVFGPGALDMKSGLVIMLTAIAALKERDEMPNRPITMLFNTDEEMGSYESRALIEDEAKKHALTLVFEPCEYLEGTLHTWRKGTGKFTIRVQGKAAHSGGAHKKGLNAIEELSHQIVKIQQLTDYEEGTTINIGAMYGGRAINIVPAYAEAEGDIRLTNLKEYVRVQNFICSLKSVKKEAFISVWCILNRPPMPFNKLLEKTFKKAEKLAEAEGIKIRAGGSGSASDANFVAYLNVPVLDGLGTIGEDFHTENEYFLLDSFISRAELTATLLRDW
ncbi:MAG: M20 family metallopeptidase [Anaerolineae bacterium]|jgi:glutamate carboxypeptidase|nr:M20 family metallopeptidase [Anaerolineae bacterium]MBT7075684.1 M20 family metallopeptidase [Anaerolineae bacterium]